MTRTPQTARLKSVVEAGALTPEQRRFVVGLSSSRTQASKIMRVSQTTLEELLNPGGNLRAVTVARARARIEELQGPR